MNDPGTRHPILLIFDGHALLRQFCVDRYFDDRLIAGKAEVKILVVHW